MIRVQAQFFSSYETSSLGHISSCTKVIFYLYNYLVSPSVSISNPLYFYLPTDRTCNPYALLLEHKYPISHCAIEFTSQILLCTWQCNANLVALSGTVKEANY